MKGNQEVLDKLQNLLNYELAARDQYLAHSRKFMDCGSYETARTPEP